MNPLSPLTYYLRHKRQTLLLVSLVALVTLGISVMAGMLYPIAEQTETVILGPLTHFSRVYPAADLALDPAIVSQIRTHPDVARVIPENGLGLFINIPSLVAASSTRVLGVSEGDVQLLMEACGLRLKEGRLLRPHTNEFLLSEEFANALGLQVGDQIDRSVDKGYYWAISTPLVLVGILESDPSVIIASYEYLSDHEMYAPRQSGVLVVARQGRKEAVEDFLETTILSSRTHIETAKREAGFLANGRRLLNLVLGVMDGLVAVVVALVVGVINQIALTRRLADVGLLHAIGHHKRRLIRGLTLETAVVAGAGWIAGLALGWLALAWIKVNFYEPRGIALDLTNLAPLWFAVPIPLVVISFVVLSIARVFARLDAVAIVERGKLSTEAASKSRRAKSSSTRPLSSWMFYLRHRRRGLALVMGMGLMILGVAFPAFFVSPMADVQKPFFLNYLRYVGEVRPGVGRTVDPGVTGQIRAHPAVERVISARSLGLMISLPPFMQTEAPIYGVSEDDLRHLVDLFDLHLEDGRLLRPRSNEIVLSKALAMNRGLHVGDTVGRPVYEHDSALLTEMVVVGILRPRTFRSRFPRLGSGRAGQVLSPNDVAPGFVSSEYLEGHELYVSAPTHLFVVPVEGRKAELDRWLEEDIASPQTLVRTFPAMLLETRRFTRSLLLLLTAVEAVVAVVAAIALAALNHIFFAQRQEEFGILHAVGHGRPWLVLRTARETTSAVTVAWLVGAVVCIVGLIYVQAHVYAPKGLSLNLVNFAPWLFTFPLPLIVVAVSTGTISWMLRRLDPVAVIERR